MLNLDWYANWKEKRANRGNWTPFAWLEGRLRCTKEKRERGK